MEDKPETFYSVLASLVTRHQFDPPGHFTKHHILAHAERHNDDLKEVALKLKVHHERKISELKEEIERLKESIKDYEILQNREI